MWFVRAAATVLLVRALRRTDPQHAAQEPVARWLIVPKTMVSVAGTECSKIGTGYTAFDLQGNACEAPGGSCLGNQIDALYKVRAAARVLRVSEAHRRGGGGWQADVAATTSGRTPEYFADAIAPQYTPIGLDSGTTALIFRTTAGQKSVVSMIFMASSISYTIFV